MSLVGQALFSPPAWLLSIHNEKTGFRFPDTQISGNHGWLKWLLVGVSIVTSSSLAVGQDQESPTDQGFASHPFFEGRNAREVTRTLYPACVQSCWDIRE